MKREKKKRKKNKKNNKTKQNKGRGIKRWKGEKDTNNAPTLVAK